jgi:hypothetical protein
MYDVFLSYHRQDRHVAGMIADHLQALGLTLWWDVAINSGESFVGKITQNLDAAKAVIVLWSTSSIRSEWVLSESSRAYDQNKLIPVAIERGVIKNLPLPFHVLHTLEWRGPESLPDLAAALERFGLRTKPPRPPVQDPHGRDGTRPSLDEATISKIGKERALPANIDYRKHSNAHRIRVFIAHASADKERLSGPLTILIRKGFRVWIDRPEELAVDDDVLVKLGAERIHYGDDWRDRISRAIRRSHTVLACWSEDAIRGRREQFYYEVYLGMVQQKLVQCRLDKVPIDEIGMPYTFSHIADLSGFRAGKYCLPLDQLMDDLAQYRGPFSWLKWRH